MLMIYHYGKAHSFSPKFAPQQASTDKHFISVLSNITKQSFNSATNWTVCSHNNKEVYWRCMVVVHSYKLYLLCQQEILRGLKIMMYRYFFTMKTGWEMLDLCAFYWVDYKCITSVSWHLKSLLNSMFVWMIVQANSKEMQSPLRGIQWWHDNSDFVIKYALKSPLLCLISSSWIGILYFDDFENGEWRKLFEYPKWEMY